MAIYDIKRLFTLPQIIMDILVRWIWILLQIVISEFVDINREFYEQNEEICMKQEKKANFYEEAVIGAPWKVYYTWDIKLGAKCFQFWFKNTTRKFVENIRNDMEENLDEEPYWEKANMQMATKLENIVHELLLIPDQGPAGRFVAVPYMPPPGRPTKRVSLLRILVRFVQNGKYLLVFDCNMGGATLATRDWPSRSTISSVAVAQKLGKGYHSCTVEMRRRRMSSGLWYSQEGIPQKI